MKLSELLARRHALLRQTRLANLAYAYRRLVDFVDRLARARITGAVTLEQPEPAEERFWPVLHTHELSPAVVEEHFTEEDIAELAEVLGFVTGQIAGEIEFRFEELGPRYLTPVREELLRAGIDVLADEAATPLRETGTSPEYGA